ncbi:hypothetical protein CHS0354_022449, partial [Potamilus streckersoni]
SVNADQLLTVKYCPLCNQTMKKYEEAPCRVCWRVYHENCIRNHPDVHNADRIALFKAKTKIGWSCYKCVVSSALQYRNQGRVFAFFLCGESLSHSPVDLSDHNPGEKFDPTIVTFACTTHLMTPRMDKRDIDVGFVSSRDFNFSGYTSTSNQINS